jgi:membrane protease YdiL (CAAX protease family)
MAAVIGLYYLVTMLGAGALGLVQPLLRLDPVILELTQFGPVLGVLAVLLVWRRPVRGRAWRPPLALGLGLPRQVLVRLLAVAAAGTGIFAAAIGGYALLGADVGYTRPGALPDSFWVIAAAQLLGACAEEFGWRCFLQPYLRTRYAVVASGTIVGVLWGLWHVQVFGFGPAYAAAFLISAIALSIILAVVLDGARGHHLLVAGVFHALVNLGLLLLMPEESGDLRAEVIVASACALAALAVTGACAAGRRGRGR